MLLDHEKAFHTITRRCQWKLLASMKLIQTWFKSNIFSNFRKLFLFLWSFWCSLPEDYVIRTAWKVSKYGFFSGPHFLVFGLNTAICRVNLRTEKRLRIWTLFTYCGSLLFFSSVNEHCLYIFRIRGIFWNLFSRIRYAKYPYSVRMWKNTDQKNLWISTHFIQ